MLDKLFDGLATGTDMENLIGNKIDQGPALDQYYRAVMDDEGISAEDKAKVTALYKTYRGSYAALLDAVEQRAETEEREVTGGYKQGSEKGFLYKLDKEKSKIALEKSEYDKELTATVSLEKLASDRRHCQEQIDLMQETFQPTKTSVNPQAAIISGSNDVQNYLAGYSLDVSEVIKLIKADLKKDIESEKDSNKKAELMEQLSKVEAAEKIKTKGIVHENVHNMNPEKFQVISEALRERNSRYTALFSLFGKQEQKDLGNKFNNLGQIFVARTTEAKAFEQGAKAVLGDTRDVGNEFRFKKIQAEFKNLTPEQAREKMVELIGADSEGRKGREITPKYDLIQVRDEKLDEIKRARNLYAFYQQITFKTQLFTTSPEEFVRFHVYNGNTAKLPELLNSTKVVEEAKKMGIILAGDASKIVIDEIYLKALKGKNGTEILSAKDAIDKQIVELLSQIPNKKYAARAFVDHDLKQFIVNKFTNPEQHEAIIKIMKHIHGKDQVVSGTMTDEYMKLWKTFETQLATHKDNPIALNKAVQAIGGILKNSNNTLDQSVLDILSEKKVAVKFVNSSVSLGQGFISQANNLARDLRPISSEHKKAVFTKLLDSPEMFSKVQKLLMHGQGSKVEFDDRQARRFNTLYDAIVPTIIYRDPTEHEKAIKGLGHLITDPSNRRELDLQALEVLKNTTVANKFITAYIADPTVVDRLPTSHPFKTPEKREYFNRMIENPEMHKHVFEMVHKIHPNEKIGTVFTGRMNELFDKAEPILKRYKDNPEQLKNAQNALASIFIKPGKEFILDKDAMALDKKGIELFVGAAVADHALHQNIFLKMRPHVKDVREYVKLHNEVFSTVKTAMRTEKFNKEVHGKAISNIIDLCTKGTFKSQLDTEALSQLVGSEGSITFMENMIKNPEVASIIYKELQNTKVPRKDRIKGVSVMMENLSQEVLENNNMSKDEIKEVQRKVKAAIKEASEGIINKKVHTELLDTAIHSAYNDHLHQQAKRVVDQLFKKEAKHDLHKLSHLKKEQVLHAVENAIRGESDHQTNLKGQNLGIFFKANPGKIPLEVFTNPAGQEFLKVVANSPKVANALLDEYKKQGVSLDEMLKSPGELRKFASAANVISDDISRSPHREKTEFVKGVVAGLIRSNIKASVSSVDHDIDKRRQIVHEQSEVASKKSQVSHQEAVESGRIGQEAIKPQVEARQKAEREEREKLEKLKEKHLKKLGGSYVDRVTKSSKGTIERD